MRFVLVGLGTILAVLFIVQIRRGKQYESMLASLDEKTFPFHTLYSVGFVWGSTAPFRFRGKRAAALKAQASLLYEPRFADYYANVVWAQAITMVHLFLAVSILAAGMMYEISLPVLAVGLVLSFAVGASCITSMKDKLAKRTRACEAELAEVVSTMAVLVNSGMILREAWSTIAQNGTGAFYEIMRRTDEYIKNGYSDADAIYLFGRMTSSQEIRKFISALLQSMEKGGGDLPAFLAHQSSELWNAKRQRMLQEGEKANMKLLIPIFLIFIGVIVIVFSAAFSGFSV